MTGTFPRHHGSLTSYVLHRDKIVPDVHHKGPGHLDPECLFEDFFDGFDRNERQFAPDIFRNILKVPFILLWQDYFLYPRPVCGKDLLLDPPDRHNRPAQGDLPGHGKERVDRLSGDQRCE